MRELNIAAGILIGMFGAAAVWSIVAATYEVGRAHGRLEVAHAFHDCLAMTREAECAPVILDKYLLNNP